MDPQQAGRQPILKAIEPIEDARLAPDRGADALILSDHGGRRSHRAASSIDALPALIDAAGSYIKAAMDAGSRSGKDVLNAAQSDAKDAYTRKSMLYGVGR